MFKRKLSTILAVAMTAVCLSSCGEATDTSDNTIDISSYKQNLVNISPTQYGDVTDIDIPAGSYISIIGKAQGPEFWNEVERGVKKAASDLNKSHGYKGEDKIKVTYNAPSESEKIGEQVNILDEELSRYPDAIVIATVDSSACPVQFDLAKDNGIPVLAMDSYNTNDDVHTIISTDNKESGKTLAEKMTTEIDGEGEIIVVIDSSESGSAIERCDGIVETIESRYEDVDIVKVISKDRLDEIRETIQEELPDDTDIVVDDMTEEDIIAYYIESRENVKGCIATDIRSTAKVLGAVDKTGRQDIAVVGYDGGKEQLEALKAGRLKGIVVQNPFGMGYASVVTAARKIAGEDIDAVVNTGYTWVTKDNMDDEAIVSMLY